MKNKWRRSFLLKYFLFIYPVGILGLLYYSATRLLSYRYANYFRQTFPKWISRLILKINSVQVKMEGNEHLQSFKGACVFICNHESILDSYVCLAFLQKIFKMFQSNTDILHHRNMRVVLYFLKVFDVTFLHDRFDQRQTVVEFQKASSYVRAGNSLLFFPAGRTSHDGMVHDFTTSCFRIPITTNTPIVPVVIRGSRAYLEDYSFNKRCLLPVHIKVLKPILTQGLNKKDQLRISKIVYDKIRDHYKQMEQTMRT